jgi:hypothetical protein
MWRTHPPSWLASELTNDSRAGQAVCTCNKNHSVNLLSAGSAVMFSFLVQRWPLPTGLHSEPQHLGGTMLERPGLRLVHP